MDIKQAKQDRLNKIERLEDILLELKEWELGKQIRKSTLTKIGKIEDEVQRDIIVKLLKDNISLIKSIEPDAHKLFLTEIVKKEKPVFTNNNLILAPVGSGKTTLIKEVLLKGQTGKILMLTSNTALKNSICPEDNKIRRTIGDRMYTSSNLARFGDTSYEIHVMSYSEFGSRIRYNDDFVQDVKQIYCDEIHSLPNYQQFSDSAELAIAIKYLFEKHENQQIYYFTATEEHLTLLAKKVPNIFRHIKIFNYLEHSDIKQYMVLSEYRISRLEQIREHLKARIRSFNYFGYKCLAFNRTISGQRKIEVIATEEGFIPISLWSINNTNIPMNEEQLRVREHLLTHGEIPEPYNFLIINSAMQEGWNLSDNLVKLAIMNTTNETEKTQALGRHRNDLDILIYKVTEGEETDIFIDLDAKYLNKELTTSDKNELCLELNLIDTYGRIRKWRAICDILKKQGYTIHDKISTIDNKRMRVSIIDK